MASFKETKQLETLLKFELDRESRAAQKLSEAEQQVNENTGRLSAVSAYRLEYMKQLSARSIEGIDSMTYNHYLAFVSKLDHAAEQVKIAMHQAKALSEHCKKLWLQQKRKVQMVEHLLAKRQQKIIKKSEQLEQKLFDEMASQQFQRKKNAQPKK
ncbi:MAG: flagellar export protein FliJ [Colwellia sp.]